MSADPPDAVPDGWARLRTLTPARVALGRSGSALPTREVLRFAQAHAQARDAVHIPLDVEALAADMRVLRHETVQVESAAPDRASYLARPDLGRTLSRASADRLARLAGSGADVVLVIADGLSAPAVSTHAAPLLAALAPRLAASNLSLGPVVIAAQARVALGDAIGASLNARLVIMLIGERPGLSAPDSLGAYLTFAPRIGRHDAERNCVSNIRPAGLGYGLAAHKLAWLAGQALARQLTGVALKDESERSYLAEGSLPLRLEGGA